MTSLLTVYVLTALSAVVVVLTRVRLAREGGEAAGRLSIPKAVLTTHTVVGGLALVVWVAFLVLGNVLLGFLGLLLWWITAVAGVLVLLRWLPAKGRHSSGPVKDTWGEGPGLSVLAHVGLLVAVVLYTVLLLLGQIP